MTELWTFAADAKRDPVNGSLRYLEGLWPLDGGELSGRPAPYRGSLRDPPS